MFDFEGDEIYYDGCLAVWSNRFHDDWNVDEVLVGDFVTSLLTNIEMCCLEYGEKTVYPFADLLIRENISKLWGWHEKMLFCEVDLQELRTFMKSINRTTDYWG